MLNIYDTEAVKTFVYKILIENFELRQLAKENKDSSDTWYKFYLEQKERAEKLEDKMARLELSPEEQKDDPFVPSFPQ